MKLFLRALIGLVLAGGMVGGALFFSNVGKTTTPPQTSTVEQPRVVRPVAPVPQDSSRREAIEGLNLRGN